MSIDFGADIYEEPIVAKTFLNEDAGETSLRPRTLAEYIGQEKAKQNLSIFIEAARRRTEALDHVLLHGPPGLGKTTLAGIIAQEMGVNIRITSGPAIEKPGDLAALLTNLNENDILFVDEIHRLNRSVEEILYPAMEDYAIDIIIGKGPSANSIRLALRELGDRRPIDVGSFFGLDEALAAPGDLRLDREADLIRALDSGRYAALMGDPLLARIPAAASLEFLPLPHPAVSGRLHWDEVPLLTGGAMSGLLLQAASHLKGRLL